MYNDLGFVVGNRSIIIVEVQSQLVKKINLSSTEIINKIMVRFGLEQDKAEECVGETLGLVKM